MAGIAAELLTYSGKIVEVTTVTENTGYIYIQFPGFTGTNQDYTQIDAEEDDYFTIYWSKTGNGYRLSVWNDDGDVLGSNLNTLKALKYNNGNGAFGDLEEDPESDMTGMWATGVFVGFTKITSW
jgi:hypothetical protein